MTFHIEIAREALANAMEVDELARAGATAANAASTAAYLTWSRARVKTENAADLLLRLERAEATAARLKRRKT
jgi:hypothetical protein